MNRLAGFSLGAQSRLMQRCIFLISVTLASTCGAAAQTPGRAITIVVPTTAGTGPDILARTLGEELQQRWGQPVIIENKAGASNTIGTQFVARAAPDGHTLFVSMHQTNANLPHLTKKLSRVKMQRNFRLLFLGVLSGRTS